jgi:hypothetical protein
VSAVFLARFSAVCGNCEGRFNPGERAKYEDDDLIHAGCAGRPASARRQLAVVVCTQCFLEKPCPCDDGQGEAA